MVVLIGYNEDASSFIFALKSVILFILLLHFTQFRQLFLINLDIEHKKKHVHVAVCDIQHTEAGTSLRLQGIGNISLESYNDMEGIVQQVINGDVYEVHVACKSKFILRIVKQA